MVAAKKQKTMLTSPMRVLLAAARRSLPRLLELTERLVRAESPSDDKSAVDACLALAAAEAQKLGGRIKIRRQRAWGNVLEARFGPRTPAARAGRVLVLGHLDTVWSRGTLETMPLRQAEGKLWGPGVLDMKAGVAMGLTALGLLTEAGLLEREVVLLLNGDEEVGSPASRAVTEAVAGQCSAVYVLEPAQGLAVKTARKGTGNFRIEVAGMAAHAGVDFEKGASALLELARAIETVSGWTELDRGLTVSVGLAGGGSKSNVVPAAAWAEVDVRIVRKADGARIERRFAGLRTRDRRCQLTVTGGINRPPMERTPGTMRLYQRARQLAAEIGLELEHASTGGASDGNFTSALGIPTLDGLGAVGAGAHAAHEHIVLAELPRRTALLAGLLAGC